MEGIQNFHHDLFFFLVVISGFVFYLLYRCVKDYNSNTNQQAIVVNHAALLEII
jgi:heme/copper-type cytochrome/quinol oxidase subunit 2